MSYLDERRAHIAAGRPLKQKKRYVLPKVSKKRQEQLKKWQNEGSDNSLDMWFEERRKEMTGICANCGKPSCRDNDEYYKFSVAHILPKAYFKSVATHDKNFLELCFWGENSCHTLMDNKMLDLIEMNCFDEIVTKFQAMYPFIAQDEKRRIPEVLMNYIDIP